MLDARLALAGTSGSLVGAATEDAAFITDLRLGLDYGSLPADLAGNNDIGEGRMWISVMALEPGEYSYDAVAVDYRVGPFSFSGVHHQAFWRDCLVPLPEGTACSLDEPDQT